MPVRAWSTAKPQELSHDSCCIVVWLAICILLLSYFHSAFMKQGGAGITYTMERIL